MTDQEMRKAIVAANKRRQRLIRAGFRGYANVNLIQDIIDTANRVSPFDTGKKRTTLNVKATGGELRRQYLAAKQILNYEKSSLRVAHKEKKKLTQEMQRRESLTDRYGFDFDRMNERRIRALYNLLNDSNVKRLMDIYSSDEVVSSIVETFNRGTTVKNIRSTVKEILQNLGDIDEAVIEDLTSAFSEEDAEE